jgi:hypothetical protein
MRSRGLLLGFRLGVSRLAPGRVSWLALLALAVTCAVAAVERTAGPLHAPSRTLAALFGVILPLLTVGAVSLASGAERLETGAWSVARYGHARGEVAFGTLIASLVLTIVLSLGLATAGLVIAYGGRVGLAADLTLTLPIAALGSAAYFGWIALGATFLRRGHGRWAAFFLDLVFGAGTGAFALPFPRGHLRSLVGGEAVLDLSQSASSAALLGVAACASLLATQRAGR